MGRIHNFNAGPAALPLAVLERAQSELLDFSGAGMSIMEMSHRSKEFEGVIQAAEANMRKIMNVSDDYAVLFLQGGASHQFAMIPMNLRREGQSADYVGTGSWATKAIKEAKTTGAVNVAWDGKDANFARLPKQGELKLKDDAAYVHITSNETIGGVQFAKFPKTKAPLVADMSSDIASRVIDVNQFGLIYAGAQKNLGPSGLAVVIIRKDLAERCPESVPTILQYRTQIKEKSLYNTPNTWAVYLVKLVTDWMVAEGGLSVIEQRNRDKAATLYKVLDASDYWKPCAAREDRSFMNITWRMGSEELEKKFIAQATAAGLSGLKGHRSVGGLRASIYNACTPAAIDALVSFMADFQKKNG